MSNTNEDGLVRCINNEGRVQYFPKHVVDGPFLKDTGFYPQPNPEETYQGKSQTFEANANKSAEEKAKEFEDYVNGLTDLNLLNQMKEKYKVGPHKEKRELIKTRIEELSKSEQNNTI